MVSQLFPLQLLHLTIIPLLLPHLSHAQQIPDGPIVPFTTGLPACASQCGPLSDVQGGCAPPKIATASQSCFCGDVRLQPFITNSGTEGVSNVCTSASCTDPKDLQAVKDWYQNYCKSTTTPGQGTATTGAPGATGTSSGSSSTAIPGGQGPSWISSHYKWVIMIAIVVFAIIGIWVGAYLWRKRYLRQKERAFELRPPVVAWGPHQAQAQAGPVDSGRGSPRPGEKVPAATSRGVYSPSPLGHVASASTSDSPGGHYKEATTQAQGVSYATPADGTGEIRQGGRGWLRKSRS